MSFTVLYCAFSDPDHNAWLGAASPYTGIYWDVWQIEDMQWQVYRVQRYYLNYIAGLFSLLHLRHISFYSTKYPNSTISTPSSTWYMLFSKWINQMLSSIPYHWLVWIMLLQFTCLVHDMSIEIQPPCSLLVGSFMHPHFLRLTCWPPTLYGNKTLEYFGIYWSTLEYIGIY